MILQALLSKGSKFRKSVFNYPVLVDQDVSNTLLIETNSFANPNPYVNQEIKSLICEFLESSGKPDLIKNYGLEPFTLNILEKRRTLIEKILSLIRFSFSENPIAGISEKIRHFYDIHYLLNDPECNAYFNSESFLADIIDLIMHDRTTFNKPPDGIKKPLINRH